MQTMLNRQSVNIVKKTYGNGATALVAEEGFTGGPYCTLSVNIVDPDCALPSEKLPKDHCYFKVWSENEGFLEELTDNGIVRPTGTTHAKTGAPIVRILI